MHSSAAVAPSMQQLVHIILSLCRTARGLIRRREFWKVFVRVLAGLLIASLTVEIPALQSVAKVGVRGCSRLSIAAPHGGFTRGSGQIGERMMFAMRYAPDACHALPS